MFFDRLLSVLAALVTVTPLAPSPSAAPALTTAAQSSYAARTAPVEGGDVSWPNCPKNLGIPGAHGYALPMPLRGARFVVVGATNGPAFTRNPCLRSQVAWVRQRHLWVAAYAVIHYPGPAELRRFGGRGSLATRLARVGAAEARQALGTLHLAGLRPPVVWVDVETVNGHPWAGRPSLNRALLHGVLLEYQRSHVRTGIYSYASAWRRITGGLRLRATATWVPSGGTRRGDALVRCRQPSFSGGPVLLGQWSVHSRDLNVTCPGVARQLPRLFART